MGIIEIIFYLGNSLHCNLYPLDVMDSILHCDDLCDVLQNVKIRLIQRIVLDQSIYYTPSNKNIYRKLTLTSMMVVVLMVVSKK